MASPSTAYDKIKSIVCLEKWSLFFRSQTKETDTWRNLLLVRLSLSPTTLRHGGGRSATASCCPSARTRPSSRCWAPALAATAEPPLPCPTCVVVFLSAQD